MKIRRDTREPDRPALGALFGGVLVVGGALAALWLRLGLPRPVCYLREWTGIPCPTCGSTRMVEALLSGDLVRAAVSNPLVFSVLTAIGLWAVVSAARLVLGLPSWSITLTRREGLGLRLLAVAALAAGWIYLIWRGT